MLTIFHKDSAVKPALIGKILWQTDIRNYPGSLKFSILLNENLKIANGDKVCFTFENQKIFCGYVFSLTFNENNVVNVLAYDQIRYLKNQDTSVYEDMTASDIFSKICGEFGLKTGQIDSTSHTIPFLVSNNLSLLGTVQKALDINESNTGEKFVIYDDFGKLTLKNTENTFIPAVISKDNTQGYKYSEEIDTDTYNQVKMKYGSRKKGFRETVFKNESKSVKDWGILQYCGKANNYENAAAKAKTILENKNREKLSFSINVLGGDGKIRAGVKVPLSDKGKQKIITVKKAVHCFQNGEHSMILEAMM